MAVRVITWKGSTTYTNTTSAIVLVLGFTLGGSGATIKDASGNVVWTGPTTPAAIYRQLLFNGWVLTMGGANTGGYGLTFDTLEELAGWL